MARCPCVRNAPCRRPETTHSSRCSGRETHALLRSFSNEGARYIVYNIAWRYDEGDEWAHVTTNISPSVDGQPIDCFVTSAVVAVNDPTTGTVLYRRSGESALLPISRSSIERPSDQNVRTESRSDPADIRRASTPCTTAREGAVSGATAQWLGFRRTGRDGHCRSDSAPRRSSYERFRARRVHRRG